MQTKKEYLTPLCEIEECCPESVLATSEDWTVPFNDPFGEEENW